MRCTVAKDVESRPDPFCHSTATYALAFVSSTEEGAEMLDELGWESVYTPLRGPTGICVPMYLNDYIFVSRSLACSVR